MRPVRTVVVGLGRMGRFHLDALRDVAEIEVVALAEPAPMSLAVGAAKLPGASTYVDVDAALRHDGAEACLIASPTPTHPALVRAALDAGLHVLCEKPLSLEAVEARSLGALAAERGLVLQVGFWRRFSPPWRCAKEVIDAGQIGRPLLVRLCQWDADAPPPEFCDPAVSGGLAVDCGVHEYDLAEWLTGCAIAKVSAWSLPIVDPAVGAAGDVDNLVAVLELDDGAVATVDLSRNARYGEDVRTEVLGSDGAVFVDLLRSRVGTSDGVVEIRGSSVDDAMVAGVAAQSRGFAAAARGRDVAVPGAEASARATEIGRAVIEAARRGACRSECGNRLEI